MSEEKIELIIQKDNIGEFIGSKGYNLKKYIIGNTKQEIIKQNKDEDLSKIFCSIECTNENNIFATIKALNDTHLDILKKNVLKHQEIFMKKKNVNYNSKFVFKTSMDHYMIPKFIGSRGNNIKTMIRNITEKDTDSSNVKISIIEDRKIHMRNLHFEKINTNDQPGEKVLIIVTMKSNNRKQSLENLREIIIEAIEKTNKKNHTNTFVPPDEPIQNSPFLNPNDFMEHDNVTFTPEINENDTQNNEGW